MSEWLDLMLEEIERKKKESDEARAEHERRSGDDAAQDADGSGEVDQKRVG